MSRIDDRRRAMNGVELAVRRVADRMRMQTPQDPLLIDAFDHLADAIADISSGADQAESQPIPTGE
jgi:hypothetical protein